MNSNGYLCSCMLSFSPLFPPELPSIAVLREVIVHVMAPGGAESTLRFWYSPDNLGLVVDLAAWRSDKTCLKTRLQDDYKKCLGLLLDSSSGDGGGGGHIEVSCSFISWRLF